MHWLVDGLPEVRRVGASGNAAGANWIGLRGNGAYRASPRWSSGRCCRGWAALLLLLGTLLLAWRVEGR
ncbi:MAG: hypothetical protein WDN08_12770 [Rhizomicrobium sp.]